MSNRDQGGTPGYEQGGRVGYAQTGNPGYESERDLNTARARVGQTMEDLRDRMSSSPMVEQMTHYARESGGVDLVTGIGRTMRNNPVPVVLIGAGLAWLAASGSMPGMRSSSSSRRDYGRHGAYDVRGGADYDEDEDASYSSLEGADEGHASAGLSRASSAASGALSSASSTVSGAVSSVSDVASSLVSGVSSAANRAVSAIGEVASTVGSTAYSAGQEAGEYAYRAQRQALGAVSRAQRQAAGAASGVSRSFYDLAEEQPLLLGAVGFAIGAAIGAAVPTTRLENEYLGAARDELKRRAQDLGSEGIDRAKAVAQRALEEAREAAEAQGLTPGSLGETVRGIGDRLAAVADAAKEGARSEVEKQTGVTGGKIAAVANAAQEAAQKEAEKQGLKGSETVAEAVAESARTQAEKQNPSGPKST